MSNITDKIKKFPTKPGIYIFRDINGKILYVGKAASLRDRVRSYFSGRPALTADRPNFARPIEFALGQIAEVKIQKTDSVLEAFFLEQELIKKYQPKYNILGKDDKSFVYVCVTKEKFPRFEVVRKTDLENVKTQMSNVKATAKNQKLFIRNQKHQTRIDKIHGPYISRKNVEEALKILRKIFPYHSRKQKTEKGCLDYQIGLCPGPYDGAISEKDYGKNIKAIEVIFKGGKKRLVGKLEREMKALAKKHEYEKAAERRNQVFALKHIQDIALLASSREQCFQFPNSNFQINSKSKNLKLTPERSGQNSKIRVEGYDISNISGQYAVGSMVVFDNLDGEMEPNKNEYRKFKIKTVESPDDVGAMKEVLERRLKNNWPLPSLIVLDGGIGHLNMAKRVLKERKLTISLLAVAKGPYRKKLELVSFGDVPELSSELVRKIRDEAHRFAIGYHRKLRQKGFIG